jgi:hypothetical protein
LLLPTHNADGLAVLPMTQAQLYEFDLRGWICLPALLPDAQLQAIRDHQMRLKYEPDGLPKEQRDYHGGPSEVMLDHPAVVGVLNEVLSHQQLASSDAYGYRFDHTFTSHQEPGAVTGQAGAKAHGGGGIWCFRGNSHTYQMQMGQVHAGLTRVVWELLPVEHGTGTHFMSGSHKSAIARPDAVSKQDSHLFDTYACPAGSVVIFTEAICHMGVPAGAGGRLSMFTCYDTVASCWSKAEHSVPASCVLETFASKRQTLFRGVWHGFGQGTGVNLYFGDDNRRDRENWGGREARL